jgi:hypothetical protein
MELPVPEETIFAFAKKVLSQEPSWNASTVLIFHLDEKDDPRATPV